MLHSRFTRSDMFPLLSIVRNTFTIAVNLFTRSLTKNFAAKTRKGFCPTRESTPEIQSDEPLTVRLCTFDGPLNSIVFSLSYCYLCNSICCQLTVLYFIVCARNRYKHWSVPLSVLWYCCNYVFKQSLTNPFAFVSSICGLRRSIL